eukprot:jgi/Ulvmu1/12046/UM083_0059.1
MMDKKLISNFGPMPQAYTDSLNAHHQGHIAPRHSNQASLQSNDAVPSRKLQPYRHLPPIPGNGAATLKMDKSDPAASQWPASMLHALGFEGAGGMIQAVMNMQQRQESLALVRDRQRHVGAALMETWLNDVLEQRPAGEDPVQLMHPSSGTDRGLRAFGISRKELQCAGLSDASIDRLHRALYVYSVGFSDMLKGCIVNSEERDLVLINVWQAYNRITEAAVAVGFKSSILDLESLREEQAAELLVVREALAQTKGDAVNLEKTLSLVTNAHLEERAQQRALQADVEGLREAVAAEKEAHRHAVQQYVAEVELRSQLQAELAAERAAKEHAIFLRSNAEEKNRQLQEENAEARQSLEILDAQVSKVTNALAMEQALASACQMQKTTVEERMSGLIDQVEMMHGRWKAEQDARMQRQHEVYQKADKLRQARVQLIEANAASREMQAENAKLNASVEELSTEMELLKGRLEAATTRTHRQEHALVQAEAQLDRKRQKKRAHKADAVKFKQLWRTFKNELNNTNARLAEEVETSATTVEQYNEAVEQARDMARALALAISSCWKQKSACKLLRRRMAEQGQMMSKVSKDRDIARAQVDVKAQQITELKAAVQTGSLEIKIERRHTAETDQMLTREKKLAAALRDELDSLKQQMSAEKDKLSSALKQNAASAARNTDLQYELEAAKRQTAAKAKELQDVKARCDAVQSGKEKTETELLQCIKQRREAQLAWNEQRAALEGKVQEAREQNRTIANEQRLLQQHIDRLQGELTTSAQKLEAKRAKKRKWKELHNERAAAHTHMGDLLRDKQFAIEKAVLRFAAADARIKAGQMFKETHNGVPGSNSGTEAGAVVQELEAALEKQRQERQELQDCLQSAKTEEQDAEAKFSVAVACGNEVERAAAQQAVDLRTGRRREVEAQVHACEHKISLYLEEISMQQLYTDPAACQLSLVGMQMEECVQDWMLEMLLISERKARESLDRIAELEADITQLTLVRDDVEGQKSVVDSALDKLDQRMKVKLVQIEQLKRDLAISYRSRDKLEQEIAALKDEAKQQTSQLREARRETEAAQQRALEIQQKHDKAAVKMEREKDAAMAKERLQRAQEAKKRDQQVKALFDGNGRLQKALDQATAATKHMASRFLHGAMNTTATCWIHELENNTQQIALEYVSGTRSCCALNLEDPLVPDLRFSSTGLVTLIGQIYLEKIQLDRVLEKQDNESDGFPDPVIGDLDEALIRPAAARRLSLEQFVFDFFLRKLGSRVVVEAHLAALYTSVQQLRHDSKKIDMFGRLLGIFDEIPEGGCDFYCATLSRVHASCGPLLQEALSGSSKCDVEALANVAKAMFKGRTEHLCEPAMAIAERLRKSADTAARQLNLDLCLHIMMEVWLEQREKDCARLCTIFQQAHPARACIVSLGEFKSMMRAIDLEQASMLPDRVVACMFREALKLSEDSAAVKPHAFFQVLHRHGVVGLKTHRLNHAKIDPARVPPWDEFKLMEESWSGMRHALDEAMGIVEHSQNTSFTYSPVQLKRAVEGFIEKKSDLADAPGAWHAYQNILRMYTNVTLTASEHTSQKPNTAAAALSEETSDKSMRHSALFGTDQQDISKSEAQALKVMVDKFANPDTRKGAPHTSEARAGRTATLRPSPKRRSTKIRYSVDEDDLDARMDTQL